MQLYFVIILVFLGIASLLFFLIYLFVPGKTVLEERLGSLSSGRGREEASYFEKPPTPIQKLLGRLGANIPLRVQDYGKYARLLIAAGIKKNKVPVFIGAKVMLAVLFAVAYLIFYGVPFEKNHTTRILFVLIAGIIGFLVPSLWLSREVKKRQTRIFHDLPDVLDLMTVCVEAGLSMDASMVRVCHDTLFKESPLINEMEIALQETRAGKPRAEALRDMGERTMEDDLKSFVAMLVQTERLGTSLAQSLRVHSDSLRVTRRQHAEEAAAKIPIKLMFPLVFFIFPALLFIILGPGVIRMLKTFGNF
jgi:tight adherence protein C